MKKEILLLGVVLLNFTSFSQSLLDLNENIGSKQNYIENVGTYGDRDGITGADAEAKAKAKPYPVLNFGSDISTGTDAIGFRPAILASTSLASERFFVTPSIRKTQVDDQSFTTQKTGQSLFIRDISNFSVNLDATCGFSKIKKVGNFIKDDKDTLGYRFGVNASFSFRGNSLFSPDSTSFESVKSDIQTVNLLFGIEYVAFVEHLSFYANFNMMSITNNRDAYHAYFPANAVKDFIYPQIGMKFKVLEGQEEFKNIIVDFSVITIGERMKTIVGTNNTIIPLLKVGYVQRISLKKANKPSNEGIRKLMNDNQKLEMEKMQLELEKQMLINTNHQ